MMKIAKPLILFSLLIPVLFLSACERTNETVETEVAVPAPTVNSTQEDERLAEFFDASAGAFASAVSVHQKTNHHRRIEGRVADTIGTILFVEWLEVDLLNGVENEPREMVLWQPVG